MIHILSWISLCSELNENLWSINLFKHFLYLGIKSIATKDKLIIYGKNLIEGKNKKINVPSLGDHRICMSSTVLSLVTGIRANIKNFETVKTSSPHFLKIIKSLGAKFEIRK